MIALAILHSLSVSAALHSMHQSTSQRKTLGITCSTSSPCAIIITLPHFALQQPLCSPFSFQSFNSPSRTMFPCCYPRCSFHGRTTYSLQSHQRRCPHRLTANKRSSSTATAPVQFPPRTKKRKSVPNLSINSPPLPSHRPSDNVPLADDDPYELQQASLSLQTQDAYHIASHAIGSVSSSNPLLPPPSRSPSPLADNPHLEQLVLYISSIASSVSTRKADELISILNHPDFSKSSFQTSISSARQCLALQEDLFKQRISSNGFIPSTITDKRNTFSATLFQKRAIDVLKQQLALAHLNNTFFQPVSQSSSSSSSSGHPAFAHPMAAALGKKVVPAIKQEIMQSPVDDIVWHTPQETGIESFIGLVQLYSDKSATSLKSSSVNSYPLHVTFLNFSDALRRKCISENLTLLGYLPTSFSPFTAFDDGGDYVPKSSSNIPRETKMNLIQRAISTILNPLLTSALPGFSFRDAHGVLRHCHPILASYCADIPEAKDILAISHGTRPQHPCPRCTVPREHLFLNTDPIPFRTQLQTRTNRRQHTCLLRESEEAQLARKPKVARTKKEEAATALHSLSLAKYTSLFESYPIFNITPLLSSYNIFAFEPLHNFHLGVSKLIKATAIERLRSDSLFSIVGPSKSKRSFQSIRTSILKHSNSILAAIEKDSPATGLHIDFSTSDNAQALNGFFTTEGLRGMLEAKDYRALDMVFPFIGAFFDRCCNEIDSSPITSVFTKYTDLVLYAMRYNSTSEWTEDSLKSLERQIRSFKLTATTVLGPYHSSHLGTLKFHLLDHIVDDIRRYGGLHFNDAGIFEHAHVLFKSHYSKTSKRRATAHNETIRAIDRSTAIKDWNPLSAEPSIASHPPSKTPTEPRKPCFVRDGKQISFYDIFTAAKYLGSNPNASPKLLQELFSADTLSIISQLGHTALHSFISLSIEYLNLDLSTKQLRQTRLTILNSGYVVGGYTPTLDNYNPEQNELMLQEPPVSLLQRIFAVQSFGPSKSAKFSHILVAGTNSSSSSKPIVWVSKLIALVRFTVPSASSTFPTSTTEEFSFVQFLEVVPPRDQVDITLNCVSLRWSTDDEHNHTTNPVPISKPSTDDNVSPWFGLVPSTSILGAVHVVRQNYPAPPFTSRLHWRFHRFYINRFYRDTASKPYNPHSTTPP